MLSDEKKYLLNIMTLAGQEFWPARSPDLNLLNFSIWSIFEIKVCSSPHPTVEALKAKLEKELAAIPVPRSPPDSPVASSQPDSWPELKIRGTILNKYFLSESLYLTYQILHRN